MSDIERTVEVYDQDENYLPVVSATEKPGGGIVVTVEVEAAPPIDDRGVVAALEKIADGSYEYEGKRRNFGPRALRNIARRALGRPEGQ